ncbi:MAG TPA: RNA polymerase sigma factor, partial [Planctomycetota bacterium]|nr:RNA polymerase sigma factor [Planctomycetota bacterium]
DAAPEPGPSAAEARSAEAVARFEAPLVRYVTRLLGDPEEARDVVQETFLKLVRAPAADTEGRMAEWLYTVARNRAVDVKRKRRRVEGLAPERAAAAPDPARSPAEAAEMRDEASVAAAALAALPENQQEALRLKLQHGLAYKEIASVMGVSATYVGWLLHVGLKAIRGRMQERERDGARGHGRGVPGDER